MTLATQIAPLQDQLPKVEYQWDFDTEILTGRFTAGLPDPAQPGTVELGDAGGSFVSLSLDRRVLAGLEVVVWPEHETSTELTPPQAKRQGHLEIQLDEAMQNAGVIELKVELSCEKNGDESVIHLVVGTPRDVDAVTLAENLLAEVDHNGQLAGFWLLAVPPFPSAARHR
ncbi:MAG: hypothetical protein JSW71_00555 [Gemmatimonadota bacterium]|nr:MAG: hypothetical protein JSW71_00555 [Gemmatimonadota bacterium]